MVAEHTMKIDGVLYHAGDEIKEKAVSEKEQPKIDTPKGKGRPRKNEE